MCRIRKTGFKFLVDLLSDPSLVSRIKQKRSMAIKNILEIISFPWTIGKCRYGRNQRQVHWLNKPVSSLISFSKYSYWLNSWIILLCSMLSRLCNKLGKSCMQKSHLTQFWTFEPRYKKKCPFPCMHVFSSLLSPKIPGLTITRQTDIFHTWRLIKSPISG